MRSLDNAMCDVVRLYRGLTYEIEFTDRPKQWVLTVTNECAPGSYLKIEVHDLEGVPVALVLQKMNVGRRSMNRFMDRLLSALEDPTISPPSEQPPSPERLDVA